MGPRYWKNLPADVAAVEAIKAKILPGTTLLGVPGTATPRQAEVLYTYPAGDIAAKDLMVAGYGCPTATSVTTQYAILAGGLVGAVYMAWFLDHKYKISLPAEVGATALLSTVAVFYTAGNNVATTARVAVMRPDNTTTPTTYQCKGISEVTGDVFTTNNTKLDLVLTTPLTVIAGDRIAIELTRADASNLSLGLAMDQPAGGQVYALDSALPAIDAETAVASLISMGGNRALAMRAYVVTPFKRTAAVITTADGYVTPMVCPLATFRNTPYWIFIEGATVDAMHTLTFDFKSMQTSVDSGNNCKLVTSRTLVLDMGATDQITWCGASVALDGSEAGDVFDFWIWVDPANKLTKLFFTNKTTGQSGVDIYPTSRCHPVAVASARNATNTTYPAADDTGIQHWTSVVITASAASTATVGSVTVARKPWFLMGASWTSPVAAPWMLTAIGTELNDSAQSGFTYQPHMVSTSRGGDRLMYNGNSACSWWKRYGLATAYDEYVNGVTGSASTIGLHDLCEIRDAVFLIVGYGINDMWDTDTAARLLFNAELVNRIMSNIMHYSNGGSMALVNRNCEIVVTSSVPAASDANDGTGTFTRGTTLRKRVDAGMPALCEAGNAIFVPVTEFLGGAGGTDERLGADVENPANKGHLTTAGYRLMAPLISAAYEQLT